MSDNPTPKRRWMPILLIVSLALNLLIVGVVLGTVLRVKDGGPARGPIGFGAALYHALPKDERKELRGQLSGLRTEGSFNRKKDFEELVQTLQSVPFDPTAVEVLLDQQAAATAELHSVLHDRWLQHVTEMSDEERATYAERLEKVVQRGPRKGKKKD